MVISHHVFAHNRAVCTLLVRCSGELNSILNIASSRPIRTSIRIFCAGFFFFGLHINTAYHSYLIKVLTNPRYMKQIDTVDEAMAFNMTFKAAENARDFFEKNDSVSSIAKIFVIEYHKNSRFFP